MIESESIQLFLPFSLWRTRQQKCVKLLGEVIGVPSISVIIDAIPVIAENSS
jgi:hypothetical protein